MFHRQKLFAIQRWHKLNAGINGAIRHAPRCLIIHLAQNNGAGAAIAFRTAFLGAAFMLGQAQIVQHRGLRINRCNPAFFIAQQKTDVASHICHGLS